MYRRQKVSLQACTIDRVAYLDSQGGLSLAIVNFSRRKPRPGLASFIIVVGVVETFLSGHQRIVEEGHAPQRLKGQAILQQVFAKVSLCSWSWMKKGLALVFAAVDNGQLSRQTSNISARAVITSGIQGKAGINSQTDPVQRDQRLISRQGFAKPTCPASSAQHRQ